MRNAEWAAKPEFQAILLSAIKDSSMIFQITTQQKFCLFPDFKMATKKMNSYDFVLLLHCKKQCMVYIIYSRMVTMQISTCSALLAMFALPKIEKDAFRITNME